MYSHRSGYAGLAILAGLLSGLACLPACNSNGSNADCEGAECTGTSGDPTQPNGGGGGGDGGGDSPRGDGTAPGKPDDGIKNGGETDVDCGGAAAPKCAEGKACVVDSDCNGACSYAKKCIDVPSCKPHVGGDTCGTGEIGQATASHESCCKTLEVKGYTDPTHAGKKVYLDKYEITAGRVRAFIAAMTAQYAGRPNVRAWITDHAPEVWDPSWTKFLPSDIDGESIIVDRNLIGDPRGTWPGAPAVPAEDEPRKTGTDFQFNGSLFMYLHGNNCSTHTNAYGFPTWFYPANVLSKMGPQFAPRSDGVDFAGAPIAASEFLDAKSMNCITNAMLAAFCAWDGGQLATSEVLDFVTDSPATLGNKAGCGSQIAQDPPSSAEATTGGRCADLSQINATYDAGGALPQAGSPLNAANYVFPFFPEGVSHDKAWEVAAPGRGTVASGGAQVDQVRINPGDEPWVDLAGNLSEAVLTTSGGAFGGKFGLKYRGIGYQSARSQLNFDPKWDDASSSTARIERAQAKAGFAGGRCMRFR